MTFWQDLRFGLRMLSKRPGLSAIVVATFALGIALTTTIFSLVNGALFKGLPFEDAHRIVTVERTNPSRDIRRMGVPVHDLVDWREQQTVFEALAAFTIQTVNLSGAEGRPERYSAGVVTANMFDMLHVPPALGRSFREAEEKPGGDPVMIIGHRVWQDRFGGSPDVLGRSARANGVERTIVGVMPDGFRFPENQDVWLPIEVDPLAAPRGEGVWYYGVARLRREVSLDQAQAQMAAIAARLEQAYPESNEGIGATVALYTKRFVGEAFAPFLLTMLGAVIGVLLVACTNVTNLLLARATARTREVAVRTALGAGRRRIVGQLFTEVMVLALCAGALGFGLGLLGVRTFERLAVDNPPPFWITFGLDHRVLLFVFGVTVFAAVFSGVFPALRATDANLADALKDEGRGASSFRLGRFSAGLVVAEVALSCGLLIAAGLMVRSVAQLRRTDLPFATEHVFTARLSLPELEYPDTASRVGFYEELLPKLEAIPGVLGATMSDGLPASGNGNRVFEVEGGSYATDDDFPRAREGIVTPGYFRTFDVEVLQGRAFTRMDRPGGLPVVVVNQSFARRFFPDGDALGRRVRMGVRDTTAAWLTVVGVVPDLRMEGYANSDASPVGFYIPIAQSGVAGFVSIAMRTAGPPLAKTDDVRAAVASIDPNLPIYNVMSMEKVIDQETWFHRVFGGLFMIFGFCALFLAAVGLYGVMSFSVNRRTQELGIRMALGAQAGQLIGLVMRRGVVQLAVGLGLGVCVAVLAAGPLQMMLYRIDARDPVVYGGVAATLTVVGLLASFIPARRVTRVDPVSALTPE